LEKNKLRVFASSKTADKLKKIKFDNQRFKKQKMRFEKIEKKLAKFWTGILN